MSSYILIDDYVLTGDPEKDRELHLAHIEKERKQKAEERRKKFFVTRWLCDFWDFIQPAGPKRLL